MELNWEQIVKTIITEYKRLTGMDCQFIPVGEQKEHEPDFKEATAVFVDVSSPPKGDSRAAANSEAVWRNTRGIPRSPISISAMLVSMR